MPACGTVTTSPALSTMLLRVSPDSRSSFKLTVMVFEGTALEELPEVVLLSAGFGVFCAISVPDGNVLLLPSVCAGALFTVGSKADATPAPGRSLFRNRRGIRHFHIISRGNSADDHRIAGIIGNTARFRERLQQGYRTVRFVNHWTRTAPTIVIGLLLCSFTTTPTSGWLTSPFASNNSPIFCSACSSVKRRHPAAQELTEC